MDWEVWSHINRGIRRTKFATEAEARGAFRKSVWSRVLFSDGFPVDWKNGVLDLSRHGVQEILLEARQHNRQLELHWVLGAHVNTGVRWEFFVDEAEALSKYAQTWWSKVLFSPDGRPVKCSSGQLDKAGIGVVAILQAFASDENEATKTAEVAEAIQTGEAPFIPREQLRVTRQMLQALMRRTSLINRATVAHFSARPYRSAATLSYIDASIFPGVRGSVALTFDDAPCRLGHGCSMVQQVRTLLREYGAKATFMIIGGCVDGNEPDLVDLLQDGHEFGNHGMLDKAYHHDTVADFSDCVQQCSSKIKALQQNAGVVETVEWFRAPHGKYTKQMAEVISSTNLTHVMCDTYACCPVIQDSTFIGEYLSQQARDGSIILLHMPEQGFRDWCFEALRVLLEGLRQRNLEAVTVSELVSRSTHRNARSSAAIDEKHDTPADGTMDNLRCML